MSVVATKSSGTVFYISILPINQKILIMKTTSEKNAAVFNDLIRINNDRTEGYRKAAKIIDGKDNGLRDLFVDLANESCKNVEELEKYETREGEEPAEGT